MASGIVSCASRVGVWITRLFISGLLRLISWSVDNRRDGCFFVSGLGFVNPYVNNRNDNRIHVANALWPVDMHVRNRGYDWNLCQWGGDDDGLIRRSG